MKTRFIDYKLHSPNFFGSIQCVEGLSHGQQYLQKAVAILQALEANSSISFTEKEVEIEDKE